MSIVVANKRSLTGTEVNVHYVGRPSPLGNPFVIGKDGTREQVIAKYRGWLASELAYGEEDSAIIDAFRELEQSYERHGVITLVCWCHPLPCHADIIAEQLRK